MKGLLDREEVRAAVQRVEVPDASWSQGASILVFTSRGVIALEAAGAHLPDLSSLFLHFLCFWSVLGGQKSVHLKHVFQSRTFKHYCSFAMTLFVVQNRGL